MRSISGIGLREVQAVYSGPEGELWELVMGEQIHIGGFSSSRRLAETAGLAAGMSGIDLCACNGAGMRFLVRFFNIASMIGVDATETVVERGRERCRHEGLADRITFVLADVTDCGLTSGQADFIWGEDAWCYVVDKTRLISEAARLVKPEGIIAFTDWVEGQTGLNPHEAERFLKFMKFPNILDIPGYAELLEKSGCAVKIAEDTRQFAPHVELYIEMLQKQLTYDALKIIGFDTDLMSKLEQEMIFMRDLARAGKIAQGRFVAVKNT